MQNIIKEIGHVGILMGGCSSEREISLKSGKAVYNALKERGGDVAALDLETEQPQEILDLLRRNAIDLVFIALHGRFGEDGALQALLEKAGIPFTGSDSQASRKSMNKILTQGILSQNGILTPAHTSVSRGNNFSIQKIAAEIGLPLVVKPACEGSSIGISIVADEKELKSAVDTAFQYGDQILLERFIKGQELTSGILGQEALALIEIRPHKTFFNFQAKYEAGLTDYIVPAEISAESTSHIQRAALKAFGVLGCRDFARADFILDGEGRAFFLEMNTIPGFTATSLLPKAAKVAGYDFADLCFKIIQLAAKRSARKAAAPGANVDHQHS